MLKLSCDWVRYSQPINVVTANFCEVKPAVNLFLPLFQAPPIKVKARFLLWRRFCQNQFDVVVWKRAYKLCQSDIFSALKILLSILATRPVSYATAERQTIIFYANDWWNQIYEQQWVKRIWTVCACWISVMTFPLSLVLLSKNLLPQIL